MIAAQLAKTPAIPRTVRQMVDDMGYEDRATAAVILRWETVEDVKVAWCACKECGGEFRRNRNKKRRRDFCSLRCQADWKQRRQQRGIILVDFVLRWRGNRGDKNALPELCRIVGWMLEEDKKAGRPSW
jgi:hypothetical protein